MDEADISSYDRIQPCMSSKVVVHGPDPRCCRASIQMRLLQHDFVF